MSTIFNDGLPKLVRDKIPAIIASEGRTPNCAIYAGEELIPWLKWKLLEEAEELFDDPCAEEFADVLQVLDALRDALGIEVSLIGEAVNRKLAERGGFEGGVVLVGVDD